MHDSFDNELYKTISDELASNNIDAALWTRAFGESGGDAEKARSGYIRLRFTVLKRAAMQSGGRLLPADGLIELRRNIQGKLAVNKRANLYGAMGLMPTSSGEEVASRIAAIEAEARSTNEPVSADLKYACGIVGDPYARIEYDRKLWDDLNGVVVTPVTSWRAAEQVETEGTGLTNWWQAWKVTIILLVSSLALAGLIGKGWVDSKNAQIAQKEAARVAEQAQQKRLADEKAEREQRASQAAAQREALERRQGTVLDIRSSDLQRQDLMREDQERRLAQQREQQLRRDQAEAERRRVGEAQYWTCVNARLDQGVRGPQATAACAGYRR